MFLIEDKQHIAEYISDVIGSDQMIVDIFEILSEKQAHRIFRILDERYSFEDELVIQEDIR